MSRCRVRSFLPRARFGRVLSHSAALVLGAGLVVSCGAGGTGGNTGAGGDGGAYVGPTGNKCAADCSSDAAAPFCDPASGQCVQCLPEDDTCADGQYCDSASKACVAGCGGDEDCAAPLVCNMAIHACSACATDEQCAAGSICGPTGECAPGCSASQPCETGSCCGNSCADLEVDPLHCGACDKACGALPNADVTCVASQCTLGACAEGFADCNVNPADGCEWDLVANGPCACTPGDTMDCYTGPPGTQGVGACAPGTSTCNTNGTGWGACLGQTIPAFDTCNDGVDNDCDGTADNPPDQDGDGWTACQGDCCDSPADCGSPTLVNPGAFEVAGNLVDDDCDGAIDNVLTSCDAGLTSNSGAAGDYAKAIDLCATTVESPATPQQKKWGVISAKFSKADGTGAPPADAKSIRTGFGSGISPLQGSSLAVLSTGVAAARTAPNNTSPNWVAFQGGKDSKVTSGVPADWLAANANKFPNAPGCPAPQGGTTVHDPVMLTVRVRAPTNANSFSVSTFFYSSEYPEWVCSPFNDFFLMLLNSSFSPGPGEVANPVDKNLAFYDPPPAGGPVYPVGVNLAFGNTGLFSQCLNGPTGCGGGSTAGTTNTCTGITQLTGTGFDIANPPTQFSSEPAYCGASNLAGGGTGWLNTGGNVKPGETIELRFVTWDTGDGWYDSTVLLDNFTWSVTASTPGTIHQ